MEKGSKGGEHIKNYGQQVMSVRTPEHVRRLSVSASHIIQSGNDLFIGKIEAYIMNRKKKEKLVLSMEGNVYVLDLFVRVPSSVAALIVYTPMEVDAINQVADRREQRKRATFDCNNPAF